MKNPDSHDYVLGVVGAGAMGQGIAQVAATSGLKVVIYDVSSDAATKALRAIGGRIERLVEKGTLAKPAAEAAISNLAPAAELEGLSDCDTVVEAIVENLDVKKSMFRELERVVSTDCILASNTSSIPITSIASACELRGRIAGLHFFNPVPLMRLVEVIEPVEAAAETIDTLEALSKRLGRTSIRVKDSPGFLVNMGGRAMSSEGVRLIHENVATPVQIDAVMRDCFGFRMGPFELMDLTGIDVNFAVTQFVWSSYGHDPRIRPYPELKAQIDAGLIGRKAGRGWYDYSEGALRPSPDHVTSAAPPPVVALAEKSEKLEALIATLDVSVVEDDGECPLLAAPIGDDATATALRTGADPSRLVCIDLVGNIERRTTIMMPVGGNSAVRDAVASLLSSSGRKVTAIKESPGFIGQRMVAAIVNLGCYIAEIGLAAPKDIDTALELGLNYPAGPLRLGEEMGSADVLAVLVALQSTFGEERYRPSPWLSRRARLGMSLHAPA